MDHTPASKDQIVLRQLAEREIRPELRCSLFVGQLLPDIKVLHHYHYIHTDAVRGQPRMGPKAARQRLASYRIPLISIFHHCKAPFQNAVFKFLP